jgi:hypothetical protein
MNRPPAATAGSRLPPQTAAGHHDHRLSAERTSSFDSPLLQSSLESSGDRPLPRAMPALSEVEHDHQGSAQRTSSFDSSLLGDSRDSSSNRQLLRAVRALSEVESALRAAPATPTFDSMALAGRLRAVIAALQALQALQARRPSLWIGTTRARRLLGVGSEATIRAWIGYGYLRGRRLPNGRTQVLLADVLRLRPAPAAPTPIDGSLTS